MERIFSIVTVLTNLKHTQLGLGKFDLTCDDLQNWPNNGCIRCGSLYEQLANFYDYQVAWLWIMKMI